MFLVQGHLSVCTPYSALHQFRCMQMLSLIKYSVTRQSQPESIGVSILKKRESHASLGGGGWGSVKFC